MSASEKAQSTSGYKQTIKRILKGEPEQVLGLLKIREQHYVLVRWTNGNAYVPYEFFKANFPILLLQYFHSRSEFKRKGLTPGRKPKK